MKKFFVYFNRIFIFPLIRIFIKKIEGKEQITARDNFILVANHQSSLDNWLLAFLLKEKLEKVHFLGALEGIGDFLRNFLLYYFSETIVINRKKVEREKVLKKIKNLIEKGKIVIIYPEGDCNKKKELLRGKTGAAELFLETGVEILPCGLKKEKNCLKYTIKVGKPLYFLEERKLAEKMNKNSPEYYFLLRKITDKIMNEISNLCGKPYPYTTKGK